MRQSLTYDRVREKAEHQKLTLNPGVKVYFCDPHSPWSRGFNENTNALLREYFPQGTDLSGYSQEDLEAVAGERNGRGAKKPFAHAAADIALSGKDMPQLKPKDVTPPQMRQGLIKSGVKVEVCALYLPNAVHQASDLIPGVTAANPADVAAHLRKSEVKTLTF